MNFNEAGDFEDGDAPLKCGAGVQVTGAGTKKMTFVVRGATSLDSGGGIQGAGAGPVQLSWANGGANAKVFGLGTWIYKKES